jgi:hypothetical protein
MEHEILQKAKSSMSHSSTTFTKGDLCLYQPIVQKIESNLMIFLAFGSCGSGIQPRFWCFSIENLKCRQLINMCSQKRGTTFVLAEF